MAISSKVKNKIKFAGIGLLIGLILGIVCTVFVLNFNPQDEEQQLSTSVVFERIVAQDELVSASQSYNITDKVSDSASFFDLFDIPGTENSFWYRYVGTIKAGVSLNDAEYSQTGNVINVSLNPPYIISNTPDMEKSGVLEENNNVLNPIHVEDVDAFQRQCIERSKTEILNGNLMDEAKSNAEQDIRDMFNAAFGDAYTVEFNWREA